MLEEKFTEQVLAHIKNFTDMGLHVVYNTSQDDKNTIILVLGKEETDIKVNLKLEIKV